MDRKTRILARACSAFLAGRIDEGRMLFRLAQELHTIRWL